MGGSDGREKSSPVGDTNKYIVIRERPTKSTVLVLWWGYGDELFLLVLWGFVRPGNAFYVACGLPVIDYINFNMEILLC